MLVDLRCGCIESFGLQSFAVVGVLEEQVGALAVARSWLLLQRRQVLLLRWKLAIEDGGQLLPRPYVVFSARGGRACRGPAPGVAI